MNAKWLPAILASLLLASLSNRGWAQATHQTPSAERAQRFVSFSYANINVVIAGVAGSNAVVFVGERCAAQAGSPRSSSGA